MANELKLVFDPSQTVAVHIYTAAGVSAATPSVTEAPVASGYYSADFPALAAGNYVAVWASGGYTVGGEEVFWDGSAIFPPLPSTGANAVTITVTDGTHPIQSAHVRVTKGVLSYLITTDSSGYAAFSLDDGSWIISITASGYTFAPVTLAIDASHRTFTEAMTEHSVPTPSTGQCVGTLVVLDGEGSPRAGVTVDFEAVAPTTGEGFVYDGDDAPYVSDTSGVISRLFPSGSIPYRYRVGEGKWVNFTTSANDGDTFIIASNVSG